MTKSKNTKRALLMSILSMLLCVSMLVSSTFAWFTDSVTSGTNKIVAGNLDVEVTHTNDKGSGDLKDAENLFPVELWEPGVVSYETFTVTNRGTLAFDYSFLFEAKDFNNVVVDGTTTDYNLKDVIRIGVIEGTAEGKTRQQLVDAVNAVAETEESVERKFADFSDFKYTDSLLAGEDSAKTFTVVAYWEPNVKNDDNYNVNNGKTVDKKNGEKEQLYIDIAANVYAKQKTYENDSFGNQYDAAAFNPAERADTLAAQGYTVVGSAADIPNNAEKLVLSGNIELNAITHFADGAVIDANGYTVTVKQVFAIGNPDSKNGNEKGAKDITIKNAVFEGSVWGVATGSATYENCTFNKISPYITPNTGMNISVKNCVFNDTSLQICWGEGEKVDPTTISTEITGNTFNYTAEKNTDHAIALNAGAYSDFSKVNVSNNTFNNEGVMAFSALYKTDAKAAAIVENYGNNVENNSMMGYKGSDGYSRTVVAEGVIQTAERNFQVVSKQGLLNLESVLAAAGSGEGRVAKVELMTDIDLKGESWNAINVMWTDFNGKGHTISNLHSEGWRAGLWGYAGGVTISNLTLENVTSIGAQAGTFAASGDGLKITNCYLKGTNTVTYREHKTETYTEEWGGIGAVTGILQGNSNVTMEIVAGTTVTVDKTALTTKSVYVDDLTGYIGTNSGTVTNNGTVTVNP